MDPINQDSYEQNLKEQEALKKPKSPRRSASPAPSPRQSPRRSARLSRQTTPVATVTQTPTATPSKLKPSTPTSTVNAPSVAAAAKSMLSESPTRLPRVEKKTKSRSVSRGKKEPRPHLDRCPRCDAPDFLAACMLCSYGSGLGL
ncbi:uncharacterized protein RSE6_02960 [Rhynchosporium secalis]|uniref:Uncharacterized protein n=1 Tax=Rhynchosporium secalis TaxID=38038 RepID=A0A1E1M1N3_RHYSE|nr:uncharacterized protein RSE6_02960 [Rhynchosporium secalis]